MSQVGKQHTTNAPGAGITPERQQRNAEMATAYFDLEAAIRDLRRMSALMEMAAEDTVFAVEGCLAKHIHEKVGLDGYQIHVFTQDQADGLDYAIRHTYDLIQALHEKYDEPFKRDAA